MEKVSIRILIIISLFTQVLTAFFAFVPISKLSWIYGMIFAAIATIFYAIIFFILFLKELNIPFTLFVLFIPVYAYNSLFISSSARTYCFVLAIITGVFMTVISIIALISSFKLSMMFFSSKVRFPSIILLAMSIVFSISGSRLDYRIFTKYYLDLVFYIVLVLTYLIIIIYMVLIKKKYSPFGKSR